jgi:hypothetical protein
MFRQDSRCGRSKRLVFKDAILEQFSLYIGKLYSAVTGTDTSSQACVHSISIADRRYNCLLVYDRNYPAYLSVGVGRIEEEESESSSSVVAVMMWSSPADSSGRDGGSVRVESPGR